MIADRVALLVNAVYATPAQFAGSQLFIATVFFAIQIYCDFSGYTDIARGAARVMGFELMLKTVLVSLLGHLPAGSSIRIEEAEIKDRSVIIRVSHESPDVGDEVPPTIALASELSAQTGVRIWAAGPVFLEVPGIPLHVAQDGAGGS